MLVVSETAEDGVIWLKCPNCQGVLPHMPEPDEEVEAEPEIDPDRARPYSADEVYEVGEVVHHRGWDDYGVVVAKEELPGKRSVIKVRFAKSGEIQLIEGASD
jgi:uncharacterized Zn finger protein (UPF0148 family)